MDTQTHETTSTVIRPFRVDLPAEKIVDLRQRIAAWMLDHDARRRTLRGLGTAANPFRRSPRG